MQSIKLRWAPPGLGLAAGSGWQPQHHVLEHPMERFVLSRLAPECRRVAHYNRRQSHKWLQWGVLLIIYSTPSTRRLASGCSVLQHFTCVVHNPKHSGRPCQNADILDQSAVCTRPPKQGGSHAPRDDEFAWFLPHTPSVAWPGRIAT